MLHITEDYILYYSSKLHVSYRYSLVIIICEHPSYEIFIDFITLI